jgi:DNA-binding XRE family transcriptional regulator
MQVQEKTRRIDATIHGLGLGAIREALMRALPEALITEDDALAADESIDWENTELSKRIRMDKTPGKLLEAYRERAGLSIVQLAEKTGIKYTNISAMEHDSRVIGLSNARKLALALGCDYSKLLNS